MDFVDLNPHATPNDISLDLSTPQFTELESFTLNPTITKSIQTTKGEVSTAPVETFDVNKDSNFDTCESELPVKSCSLGSNIVCPDKTGFFKIDNLFAELKTEYDKTVARSNLGIATEDLLNWGNLKGNLANQSDLVTFIAERLSMSKQEILTIVEAQIEELDAQSSITTVYYGPSLDSMSLSNSTTFTTGDYEGNIYVVSPKFPTHFYVNGLEGGFDFVQAVTKDSQTFYAYKSTNTKLGITDITVKYG